MKKKAFLVGFILLLLIAIPATVFLVLRQQELRSRAQPATNLSFDPTTRSARVGETFSLNITMDTGANSVATAELQITFDPVKLEATGMTAGSFMPHVLVASTPDNTTGRAFIAVDTLPAGASTDSVPFTSRSNGPQPVAVITFRARAETGATPTTVGFSGETRAFGETAGTLEPTSLILASSLANVARITVSAAGITPTPTPTPTVGAGTPTPTPSGQNRPPVCNSLSVSPATGNRPLTVTLTANASDQDNDVVSALFTFGDGQTQTVDRNIGQSGSIQVSHVYQNTGTITAQAIVRDNNGAVSTACTTSITITAAGVTPTPTGVGGAPTPTATPTAGPTTQPTSIPTIPVTGDVTPTAILTIAGAVLVIVGAILFFAL